MKNKEVEDPMFSIKVPTIGKSIRTKNLMQPQTNGGRKIAPL